MLKKEGMKNYPASAYLIIGDVKKPETWLLRVRDENDEAVKSLMDASWQALHDGFKGSVYNGEGKTEATEQLIKLYEDEGVELPVEAIKSDEFVAYQGMEVKALGNGKVGGYLVRFSDETNTDLSGDFFTRETDFGSAKTSTTLYNHGLDTKIGLRKFSEASLKMDEVGVWVETQLAMRDDYEKAIYSLAEKGKLGWSSGTAPHLVRRKKVGNANKILSWALGLDASLTPTPAEPRNSVLAIKSLQVTEFQIEPESAQSTVKSKEKQFMTEEEKKAAAEAAAKLAASATPTTADALKSAVLEALEAQNAKAEAAAKQAQEAQEMKNTIAALIETAMKNAPADNGGGREAGRGGVLRQPRGDDAFKSFTYFVKTGDSTPIRTGEAHEQWMIQQEVEMKTNYPMLESTQYQGQEAVPTEVAAVIHEKRNAISVVRAAGATVYPAKSNALVIPIEKGNPQKFGITTIDNSATFTTQTSQPLDKLTGTIYLFTYNMPFDMTLIDDSVFNQEGWASRRVGRGWGLTENQYYLVGTGSGEPGGAITGATIGVTSASATAVTAAEIVDHYYKLPGEYRDRPTWVMKGSVEGSVRKLTSTAFPFVGTGGNQGGVGQQQGTNTLPSGTGWLVDANSKVFNSDEMDAITASKKPILVGNFEAGYAIIERKVLTVLRDPYSAASKGMVNFWWYFRQGGGVTDALAFYYLATPSA